MKSLIKIFLLCLLPAFTMAQKDPTWGYVTAQQADSLKRSVVNQTNDTLKLAAFRSLGFYYQDFIADSGLYFHEQQLVLSKKLNMKLWQADAYSQAGYCLSLLGDYMKSYEYFTEAMKLADDKKNESENWRLWTFSNSNKDHPTRRRLNWESLSIMAKWYTRVYQAFPIFYHPIPQLCLQPKR
ncbi:MAG: hypothetical protein HYR66_09420 [Sphingobacteriales bacterium]|nr:hypothetical protein [Sphingobacteriales bacterium]